jgi:3'-phosphoadenosine 5'-phosphosulfate synthase
MRENEYLQSLHFNSLRMGNGTVVNMSLPIVLAIDDETKENIGSAKDVGLVGPDGDLLAILRRLVNPFLFYLFVVAFKKMNL